MDARKFHHFVLQFSVLKKSVCCHYYYSDENNLHKVWSPILQYTSESGNVVYQNNTFCLQKQPSDDILIHSIYVVNTQLFTLGII